MNRPLLFLLTTIIFFSCSNSNTNTSMDGAYVHVPQFVKGVVADTNQHQLIIYTGSHVMQVTANPLTSAGAFSIGSYSFKEGKLTSLAQYTAIDTAANTASISATAVISKSDNGYTETTGSIGDAKSTTGNEYRQVSAADTSVLDGIWKQVTGFSIKGKDTTVWADVQYKAFYGGYFAYGNYAEPTKINSKRQTYTSYGTFSISGGNVLKQNIEASNEAGLIGKTVEIQVTLNGKDMYEEHHTGQNGEAEVIYYQRVK